MLPFLIIAISVVPPPISTKHTPSSFSSLVKTASLDAKGWRTSSTTSNPHLLIHLTIFWAAAIAPETI